MAISLLITRSMTEFEHRARTPEIEESALRIEFRTIPLWRAEVLGKPRQTKRRPQRTVGELLAHSLQLYKRTKSRSQIERRKRTMAKVQKSTDSSSLAEVVDRILDKGIVIDAWVKVSLVGIELLSVEARVVIASVETYLKYAEAIGLTASAAAPA